MDIGHKKTPQKSFMPIIEEWVLVANPYVGYRSSILFLVLHNRAFFFFLRNTHVA